MEVRHRTDSPWRTWSSVPEFCYAEGAVSLPAWGTAPGIRKTPNVSAESAIHFLDEFGA